MKKLVGLVLILGLAQTAWAQDIIKTVSGEELQVTIREIANDGVVYRLYADTAAADQRMAMDQIQMIKLEQGAANPDLLKNLDKSQYVVATGNADQNRKQGRSDARRVYKGHGAMWGTFAATAIYPPAGLVTGAIVAAVPPNAYVVGADPVLLNDPDYRQGFRKQAHNKKVGKAAAGFGLGLVGWVVLWTGVAIIVLLTLG